MKPNYMVIGASKCATTTICTLLKQHPDCFMTECREPNFFSNNKVYALGFDWYESLYRQGSDKKMRGESSNHYTMKEIYPKTVSRIVSYTTELKLIYIVRNPISRIESYWMEKRSQGGEQLHYDFNTSVYVNRDWLVDSSNYWQQLEPYRPYFSEDRIHIIFYEDFKANPEASIRHCFEFLGLDPDVPLANPNLILNRSSNKTVPRHTLSRLREHSMFRASVKLIPELWRDWLKTRLFFKKIQERPKWNLETLDWAIDTLEADTHKFLEYYGKPKNFWNLRAKKT